MNKEVIITKTNGDESGSIDDLIKLLTKAKKNGATHYRMKWSQDPNWSFKWFETYRIKSDDEIKDERIKELEQELKELKNG
jgi:hypothetical protein